MGIYMYVWYIYGYLYIYIYSIMIKSGSYHTHHLKYLSHPWSKNLQGLLFRLC